MNVRASAPAPRRVLSLAIAAALCASAAPAPSRAQSSPAVAVPEGRLEEITVTARKREESLQEVPIAVTAFSAAAIESIGMKNLEDIALRTPGLQFSQQAGQIAGRYNCSIRFRGMNVNSEQAVYQLGALFIDGIYVASGCSGIAGEDLERVEVVKGPQAVYFGRNTFGGAVNYVTKDPGNEWRARVAASVAEDDDFEYTGSVEGPVLQDRLAFRLSGRYYDRSGLFTSNFGDALGEEKTRSVTLKLKADPIENLEVRIRAYYGEDRDGPPAGGFISGNLNDTCTGTTGPGGVPRRRYVCGTIPGIDAARTANRGRLISYNTSLNPASLPTRPNFLQTQLLSNGARDPAIDDAIGLDYFGLKRNTAYVGAVADYTFANDWTLSAVYGYNKMRANWLRDFDFTDVESWWSTDPQNLKDENYELRLTSNQDGALTWVAGASYYSMDYTQSGNGGTAVTVIPVGGGNFIASTFNNSLVNNVNQTYTGVFGGLTWKFAEGWSLSAEARWQKDELEKGQLIAAQAGLPVSKGEWTDVLPRVILQWQPTPETNLYASYSVGVLPGDINAEYIYGPDNMRTAEQIASVRTQVQNGAAAYPALGLPTATPPNPQAADFLDREKLDSYEIGWKQQWLDGRASTAIAVYRMKWENQKGRVAGFVVDFNGNTNQPFVRDTVNALGAPCTTRAATDLFCNDTLRTVQLQIPGSSTLQGIEFEGTFQATDSLRFDLGAEYTSNEYDDFTFNFVEQLAGTSNMKGNSSPRYPQYKGNFGANWQAELGSTGWQWFARADLIYFGSYYVDESNLAKAPSQLLLSGRAGLTNENWRVELFGNNLTDEDSYASAGRWSDFSIPGNFNFPANQGIVVTPQRPRFFGLRVAREF